MKPCSVRDCRSSAEWRPVLLVRHEGYNGPPGRAQVSLDVCAEHRFGSAEELLADTDIWLSIVRGLVAHGRAAPARSLTRLEYIRLSCDEARGFDRGRPS